MWPASNCSIPYDPSIAGTTVWAQCAWNDTVNGRLLFTRATENTIPRLPRIYRRKCLYQRDNFTKNQSGYLEYANYEVVARYAK